MKRRVAVLALVALLALTAMVAPAAAATRSGGTVVVGADETVEEDLTAYAGTVIVQGTVEGDLTAYGGNVFVDGNVTGDVEVFGGTLDVAGGVGGDVRAFGGTVTVAEGASVGGALTAGAGSVTVDGAVAGDARLDAGSVRLGPGASVGGDLTYSGELTRATGAAVAGSVTQDADLGIGDDTGLSLPDGVFDAYWLVATFVVGAVLLLAFPGVERSVVQRVRGAPARTLGVGLLALVGVPVALVVSLITVVGIPLAVAGLLVYLLLLWVASIYGRIAVGAVLLSYADVENRWAALAVGLLAVAVAARVLGLVPFVGTLFTWAVDLLGLGALVLLARERYRATPAA